MIELNKISIFIIRRKWKAVAIVWLSASSRHGINQPTWKVCDQGHIIYLEESTSSDCEEKKAELHSNPNRKHSSSFYFQNKLIWKKTMVNLRLWTCAHWLLWIAVFLCVAVFLTQTNWLWDQHRLRAGQKCCFAFNPHFFYLDFSSEQNKCARAWYLEV